MSDRPQREWRFYVADMLSFARNVQRYTAGLSQADFAANALVRDATLRKPGIDRRGGNARAEHLREAHPRVPWRLVVATRNRLIHGYLGLDDDTIWSIVQSDIPVLIAALNRLRQDAERPGDG